VTKRKETGPRCAAAPDEEAEPDRQSTRAKFPLLREFKEDKAIKSIERSHLRDCRITWDYFLCKGKNMSCPSTKAFAN